MAVQIQIRRGTAAEWTSVNPTLADGEMGYETDTGKLKFGDGATAWSSLEYFGADLANASIGDIGDVTITSVAEGELLVYRVGSGWVNEPPATAHPLAY